MAWTVLVLSDHASDVRDLLPDFPGGPWRLRIAGLKSTEPAELIPIHPEIILIDASTDLGAAEETTRQLSLAWEIGLPPLIVVVDEEGVSRFRFEVGADDFLVRGASSAEISARLDLLIRRSGRGEEPTVLKIGDLTVNPENYQVYMHGRPLDLTYKEFELLKFLAQRPGRVCDRDMLLREVWGYDYYGGARTVDVHVRRLRWKIEDDPRNPTIVQTVRGLGYKDAVP